MEIKLVHRDQIDIAKWNGRVEQSGNSLPYALSAYLDLVTDSNWSALVSGDYNSIFPLPYEKKMGVKMYLQPPFTQQLGLISDDHSIELLSNFIKAIPNDFAIFFLKGNETNSISNIGRVEVKERSNYLLNLNTDYEYIFSNYSKSLRKRIKKSKEYYAIEESTDVDMLVDFYHSEMQSRVGLNEGQYTTARKLFKYLITNGIARIYVANKVDTTHGVLLVLHYRNRIINLFGTSNSEGKKHFAMHCILDHIIEENSSSVCILDFEGSDLNGVKEFYESFGPERKTYPEFHIDHSPIWLTLAKKIKRFISTKS